MNNTRKQDFDRIYKVYPKKQVHNEFDVVYSEPYTKLLLHERMSKEELYQAIKEIEEQSIRERQRKTIRRPKSKPKKRTFTGKRIASVILAIFMLAGAKGISNAYINFQQQNESAGIVQILKEGTVKLEELGITNEQVSKLIEMQNELEREDITDEELINLIPQVYEFQIDIIKSKISNVLGVSTENIRVHSESTSEGTIREYIEIKDEIGQRIALYNEKDIFTNKNTISEATKQMIISAMGTRAQIKKIKDGEFEREDIIIQCTRSLKETSQFAGMKLKIDEKGNMRDQKIKFKDLEQKNSEDIYNQAAHDVISNNKGDEFEL